MNAFKKNIFDTIIIVIFICYAIIDIFSFFNEYSFVYNLFISIVFVILFELAYRYTKDKNARYKSLVKAIYFFAALLIGPTIIMYYNNIPFAFNGLRVLNICIPVNSIIYLFYYLKNNKQ